jgi:cytochrome c
VRTNIRLALTCGAAALAVALTAAACTPAAPTSEQPAAQTAEPADGSTASTLTGQALADSHLSQWKLQNPDRAADWVAEEKERHAIRPPFDNSYVVPGEGPGAGQTYGQYTARDVQVWARETEKLVVEGSRIFHSGELLKSTVAVSCDMCHPDGANTHPETYPKFQVQMGRVALLRDMINWCIQQPVRGERLADDSPEMRALEAYIYAQRTGTPLAYGKH